MTRMPGSSFLPMLDFEGLISVLSVVSGITFVFSTYKAFQEACKGSK